MAIMTIFADASYCSATKSAGWGAWVKADGFSAGQINGGALEHHFADSTEAELFAVVRALKWATKLVPLTTDDVVVIQCDNVKALAILKKHALTKNVREAKVKQFAVELPPLVHYVPSKVSMDALQEFEDLPISPQFWVRHVKGHKGKNTDGRSWVNEKCDEVARRYMREVRASRQKEK